MKVLNENSEEITVRFDKTEFRMLQNFFICNKPDVLKEMCVQDEFKVIEKLVYLKDVDKGLFEEISDLLKSKK